MPGLCSSAQTGYHVILTLPGTTQRHVPPRMAECAGVQDAVQLQSRAPPSRPTGFQQTQVVSGSEAVKVTLNDCLACSGCVTSAETVLLEHQSIEELQVALADPQKTVIVSGDHRHSAVSQALLSWLLSPRDKATLLGHQHCSAVLMRGVW